MTATTDKFEANKKLARLDQSGVQPTVQGSLLGAPTDGKPVRWDAVDSGIFTAWMPALARSASKDGELPVSVAEQEPGNPRRDQVVAVRGLGDGGDLQRVEIRRIVGALTP